MNKKYIKSLVLGVCLFLITSVLSFADDVQDPSKLKQMFDDKRYQEIVSMYENRSTPGDDLSLILVGASYRNIGETEKSVYHLSDLISKQKLDLNAELRARFELGISCYLDKDFYCAKKELETIIGSEETPRAIKKRAEVIVADIKKDRNKHLFHGSVGTGYVYDSNPGMLTSANDVLIYGVELSAIEAKSDNGVAYDANLGYNVNLNRKVKIFGDLHGYTVKYNDLTNRNIMNLVASQGVSYQHKRLQLSLPLTYRTLHFGKNTMSSLSEFFMRAYGADPSISWNFGPFILRGSYQMVDKHLPVMSMRDSTLRIFNTSIISNISKYTSVYLNYGKGIETANSAFYNSRITTASVGIKQKIFEKLSLSASYATNKMDFQNYDYALTAVRDDRYNVTTATLNYAMKDWINVYTTYLKSSNNSNVTLYHFNREQITTGIRFMF